MRSSKFKDGLDPSTFEPTLDNFEQGSVNLAHLAAKHALSTVSGVTLYECSTLCSLGSGSLHSQLNIQAE